MDETRTNEGTGLGIGMIFGIVLVVLIIVLVIMFGTNLGGRGENTPQAPSGINGDTEIQVPDEVDVNINDETGGQ